MKKTTIKKNTSMKKTTTDQEECDNHDVNPLEIINNDEQVDEKDNNQEEHESESHEVNPFKIIVEEIRDSEEEAVEEKNMIIHQYHVTINIINIKQPKSDQEDSSFLEKVIKNFTENVEYNYY